MRFCRLLIFFKINIFEKFFQEFHLSVKQIGSRSGSTFCQPDLGPNCLHKLSADDTRRQKVKSDFMHICQNLVTLFILNKVSLKVKSS